jgi:hypothetical protein
MPNRICPCRDGWKLQGGTNQTRMIAGRNLGPATIIAIKQRQFLAQESRLQFIETRIQAIQIMLILDSRSIISPQSKLFGEFIIIGRNCPAISQRAKILTRVETETSRVPK